MVKIDGYWFLMVVNNLSNSYPHPSNPDTATNMDPSADQKPPADPNANRERRVPDAQVFLELETILDELAFTGFNPRILRESLYANNLELKELIMILGAYLSIGNKVSKISKRRLEDQARITAYNAVFTKYGIVDSGVRRNPSDTTLAQIAIAFSPIVLMLRQHAAERGNLQNQFPQSGLLPVFQDPCLGPLAVASGLEAEYRRYSYQFFKALAPTRQQSPAREVDWLQIACSGFSQDLAAGEVWAAMQAEETPTIQELVSLMRVHDENKTGRTTPITLSASISDARMKAAMDLEQKADEEASAHLLSILAPSAPIPVIRSVIEAPAKRTPSIASPTPRLEAKAPVATAVAPAKKGILGRVLKR